MPNSLTPSVLTWLRAFDTAVRHSSFTRAAEELHLTQGSISQQVKQLEIAFGFAVFVRELGALRLTAEGEALHALIGDAFSALREAAKRFGDPTSARPVKLSCSPGFAVGWLNSRMIGFIKTQPRLDFRLHAEVQEVTAARMSGDQIGAAIRYAPLKDEDTHWLPVLDELLIPVASPAYLKDRLPGDLNSSDLLHDAQPWDGAPMDVEWTEWVAGSGRYCTDLSRGRRFNLTQLALGAARDGAGVAMGRLAIVLNDLKAGRLIVVAPYAVRSSAGYNLLFARGCVGAAAFRGWILDEGKCFTQDRDDWLLAQNIRIVG